MDQLDLLATTTQAYMVKENDKVVKDAFYFPSSETTTVSTALLNDDDDDNVKVDEKVPLQLSSIPVTSVSSDVTSVDLDTESTGSVKNVSSPVAAATDALIPVNSLSIEGKNSLDDLSLDETFKSQGSLETTTVYSSPVMSTLLASNLTAPMADTRDTELTLQLSSLTG